MKVVITGANGFIAKNLLLSLLEIDSIEIETITRSDDPSHYARKVKNASYVFHLAGVNRAKNIEEYEAGNVTLTDNLLKAIDVQGEKVKFILASSIHADKDNAYGRSKQKGEQLVEDASKKGKIEGIIYRLPGIFGKWCKPNYNSVVATFCYNIANDLPINIHDPNKTLKIAYIDNIVDAFLSHLSSFPRIVFGNCTRLEINTVFTINLGELAKKIQQYKSYRTALIAPKVNTALDRYLYTTYLSYLPKNMFSYPLTLKADERGYLFEWLKSENFGQVFVSVTKPGITRGNHYHHTKTEKFLVVKGQALIQFRKITSEEIIDYHVDGINPTVVDIPPGYTHNITNIGDEELITLFWSSEIFSSATPDTYYKEV